MLRWTRCERVGVIALIQIIRFEEQLVLVVLFVSVEALVVLDGDGVVIVAVVEAGEDAGEGNLTVENRIGTGIH